MKSVAEYFCEDTKKFKLEELLGEVLSFIRNFQTAAEVVTAVYTDMHMFTQTPFNDYHCQVEYEILRILVVNAVTNLEICYYK